MFRLFCVVFSLKTEIIKQIPAASPTRPQRSDTACFCAVRDLFICALEKNKRTPECRFQNTEKETERRETSTSQALETLINLQLLPDLIIISTPGLSANLLKAFKQPFFPLKVTKTFWDCTDFCVIFPWKSLPDSSVNSFTCFSCPFKFMVAFSP